VDPFFLWFRVQLRESPAPHLHVVRIRHVCKTRVQNGVGYHTAHGWWAPTVRHAYGVLNVANTTTVLNSPHCVVGIIYIVTTGCKPRIVV